MAVKEISIMEVLVSFFAVIIEGFQMPFTVYGFTFSFWDLMIFSVVMSVLVGFVGRVLNLFA